MAKRFREQEVLLKTLLLSMILSYSLACPPSCYCFDVFVTCSDFKSLNLTLLPPDTDTLVISRGEMEEIPSGFLPTATNLKMLEISALSAKVVRSKAFAGKKSHRWPTNGQNLCHHGYVPHRKELNIMLLHYVLSLVSPFGLHSFPFSHHLISF